MPISQRKKSESRFWDLGIVIKQNTNVKKKEYGKHKKINNKLT